MKNFSFRPAFLMVLAVALISYACTEVEDSSESASLLVVSEVTGVPGGEGEEDGVPLLSDTCDNANDEIQDPAFCAVFNDNAEVTFDNHYLQIGPGAGFNPSFMNDIIVTQFRVDFVRPNNRNTPGVDVPFGIDGTMNVRVNVDSTASGSILIVRHVAKREPPLAQLVFGGEDVLTANAQMRFFGHDIAGRNVTAVGLLEVHFANFAESE
ncbi:hypothetical protein L0222_18795 [bacterium]|nr:hypothetical protein [bacterium]MCI0606761.1 hypothetical protein [bacterium]